MEYVIVDVRSPAEFSEGHVKDSINIPLNTLPGRLAEIRTLKGRIALCCASGGRSGQAELFLKRNGVDCVNVGSWQQAAGYVKS